MDCNKDNNLLSLNIKKNDTLINKYNIGHTIPNILSGGEYFDFLIYRTIFLLYIY